MGATAWMMEAWVERTMQVVKRAVMTARCT